MNKQVLQQLQREFPGSTIELKKIKFVYEDERGRLIPTRGMEIYIDGEPTGELLVGNDFSPEFIRMTADFIKENLNGEGE